MASSSRLRITLPRDTTASSECKRLPEDLQAVIRSESTISSLSRCVEELIYNSLDAGSTDILVKVDFSNFHVMVQDNGKGMSVADMENLGKRYATSKLRKKEDLAIPDRGGIFGYKGESLASIIALSDCVSIISKRSEDQYSCKKRFVKGRPEAPQPRDDKFSSQGFVVNVKNFLSAQPVRQRRFNVNLQQEGLKTFIQIMSFILRKVHISIWDMETNAYIAKLSKTEDPSMEFFKFCFQKSSTSSDIDVATVEPNVNGYRLEIVYCTQGSKTKQAQFLFVNSRPVSSSKWAKAFNDMLGSKLGFIGKSGDSSKQKSSLHAMFVVNIVCALNDCTLLMEENKLKVDFVNPKKLEFAIQVGSMMLGDVTSSGGTCKGRKRKSSSEEEMRSSKSKMTGTEVVKEIQSHASINNHRGAVVSQPAYRPNTNPLPKHRESAETKIRVPANRLNNPPSKPKPSTLKVRDVTIIKDTSSSASSIDMFPESPVQQNIVESRVTVLKPIGSHTNSSRFLPKKGPFGKQCERTINTAGSMKRKKQRDSLDPNNVNDLKRTKVQLDGIQLWTEGIQKVRQGSGSGSDDFMPTFEGAAAAENRGDSEGESVISHSMSRLSMTPVTNNERRPRVEEKSGTPTSGIEVIKEFKTAASNLVRREHQVATYKDHLKRRMSDHMQRKQPSAFSNSAERGSLPAESQSRAFAASATVNQENSISSRGQLHHSQGSQGYSVEVAKRWVESNLSNFPEGQLSQQSRMSQTTPPPIDLNFQNIGVRQRDPILRARNQESRNKRNAVHFESTADFRGMFDVGLGSANLALHSSQEIQHGISMSQPNDFFPGEQRREEFPLNFYSERNEAENDLFSRDSFSQPPINYDSSLAFNPQAGLFNLEELHPAENLRGRSAGQPTPPVSLFSPPLGSYLYEERHPTDNTPRSPYFDFAKQSTTKLKSSSGSISIAGEISSNVFASTKSTSIAADFDIISLNDGQSAQRKLNPQGSAALGGNDSDRLPAVDLQSDAMNSFNNNISGLAQKKTTPVGIEPVAFMIPQLDSRKQFRNQWLRATFPGTSSSYWTTEEPKTTSANPAGNLQALVDNPESLLAATLKACLERIHDSGPQSKWRSECGAVNFPVPPTDTNDILRVELRSQNRINGSSAGWSFSKDNIKKASVIGTLDDKFIVAKINMKYTEDSLYFGQECTLIVIFDQHAVHERIRLESLIADLYEEGLIAGVRRVKMVHVTPELEMEFPMPFVDLLIKFKEECCKFGIILKQMGDGQINVSHVPICFLNRIENESQRGVFCSNFLSPLFGEIVGTMLDMQGARVNSLPKTILNELKLQACRGAVKFGDKINLNTACDMISDLRKCNMPFQCAHGRPTVYPLYELRPED